MFDCRFFQDLPSICVILSCLAVADEFLLVFGGKVYKSRISPSRSQLMFSSSGECDFAVEQMASASKDSASASTVMVAF